jgi:hypothetical protein
MEDDVSDIICQALRGGSGRARGRRGGQAGRCRLAVSTPVLKAPITERVKLECDNCFEFCYNFAFNFNLRCYGQGAGRRRLRGDRGRGRRSGQGAGRRQGLALVHFSAQPELFLTHSTPQ